MATDFNSTSLNLTKLQRPRAAAWMVARPRLFELLAKQRPLTLVVAPAGFGKTTLLSAWLATQTLPYGWLTLDEGDSDAAVFLSYLLAALQEPAPGVGRETRALLSGPAQTPPKLLARHLINELDGFRQPFVVVLDDYHLIKGDAVHAILRELLLHPYLPLRLVLAARHDPPLPIANLRAHDRLTEVRAAALRFSPAETTAFLRRALDVPIAAAAAAALEATTEGWVAGLHLAAYYLRGQQDPVAAAARLDTDAHRVIDFLATEILQQQSPALQAFLVKTSILDRLCAPLCAAVVGSEEDASDSASEQLRWVETNNLFCFALDAEGRWYRYHPLFQRLLQHHLVQLLTPLEIAALHARASAWLASAGYVEEALTHAIAAGELQAAVHLIAQQRHKLMNREQWETLYRWLCFFDRATIDQHPALLLTEAWLMLSQSQVVGIGGTRAAGVMHPSGGLAAHVDATACRLLLQKLDALLAQEKAAATTAEAQRAQDQLAAESAVLRCELLYATAAPDAIIALASDALAHLPPAWQLARSQALLVLAAARQMRGELAEAYALFEGSPHQPLPDLIAYQARMGVDLCMIQWVAADLPALLLTAGRALPLAEELNLAETLGWANYFIGAVYYHWNELDRAVAALEPVIQQPHGINGNTFASASCALALTYQAQGRSAEAHKVMTTAVDYLRATNNLCLNLLEIFEVELALRQGKVGAATQWAALHAGPGLLAPVVDFVAPQLTRPKILLAQTSPAAHQEAVHLLLAARDYFAAIHNTRFLIETLALLALAWWDEDGTRALAALAEALRLAAPGGLLRVFVDIGPRLLPRLELLAARNVAPTFVAQIVAALQSEYPTAEVRSSAVLRADRLPVPANPGAMLEALTPREQEILALLARRLTNKEIAHTLGIAADTVKEYISNLFGKLAVNDRRSAVAKGLTLGLLPPVQK